MIKYVLFTGLCILLIIQVIDEYKEDWSQFGQNPQHAFFSGASVPTNLDIAWQYQFEPSDEDLSRELFCSLSSPAVVNNVVYVPTRHALYCLDLHTGKFLQEVPAYAIYPYTPTIGDGRVYLAAEHDLFRCVDTTTGKTLWEREVPDIFMVSPLVDDETVYVTVDQSYLGSCVNPCIGVTTEWSSLLALDKETGEETWHLSLTEDPFNTGGVMKGVGFPILVDETIFFYAQWYKNEKSYYVNANKSGLIALDTRTGTLKWKCEGIIPSSMTDSIGGLFPFCLSYGTGRIYVSTSTYMFCMDTETQEPLWEYKDVLPWGLLSVGNGVVVVCTWIRVDCLDAETGEVLWNIPIGGQSMPAMTEHEVFIGSADEYLYRVDIKTGKIFESYYVGEAIYSPIVVDEHILFATHKNVVYCLGPLKPYYTIGVITGIIIIGAGLLVLLKKGNYKRHTGE